MNVKKALHDSHVHGLWVAALFAIALWLMSVLNCELATPAY